jgi:alpha-tubulin suppressor-like RCC1 family protein
MEVGTVAAGLDRSFFVDANDALLACGKEEQMEVGLLGLREGNCQTAFEAVVPTPVPSMVGFRLRAVACTDRSNLAVSEAGQVFAWGCTRMELTHAPVPTVMEELRNHRVCQVVASDFHCAALTEDGALFTWKTRGPDHPIPELGYGCSSHGFGAPHRVLAFEGVRIASVALGAAFTVAVTEAGEVHSFGLGDGRLGHGRGGGSQHVYRPKRIEAFDGIPVATVVAGSRHSLALTMCGRVYSWGGAGHDGNVYGLGYDSDDGGDGNNGADGSLCVPKLITALLGERVRAIAAGSDMSWAVTDAGALYTWGRNRSGVLGHGDSRNRKRPKLVTALHGITVVGVSISSNHTLALAADGSVSSLGEGPGLGIRNEGGGEGAGEMARTPRRVPSLTCMVPRR